MHRAAGDTLREKGGRKSLEVNSVERYRQIVESAEDMIYSLSPDGHFTFVNSAAAAIVKRSVDECLGLHFLSLVREDFRKTAIDFYQQQIQDMIPATYFEFPVIAGNGAEIWIGQNLQLAIEDGEIVELQALGRNITSRKETEELLQESERRYRLLFESNPHPMWVFDEETLAFLAVNDAAIREYGYSRTEFLGMTIENIRASEELPSLFAHKAKRDVGYGSYDSSVAWRHQRKDGSFIDVEITWHMLDFEGRSAKLVLAHNVTERRKAETDRLKLTEEIEDQRRRLNNILSSIPCVVWESAIQANGGVPAAKFVNSYLEEMLGYTVEEWLSTPDFWFSTLHPEDRTFISKGTTGLLSEGHARNELRWITRDQRVVWAENQIVLVKDEAGKPVGVRGVMTDITGRKRLEVEREAIFEIIQGVITTDNLEDLFKLIHQSISRLLYAENCFIALHDSTSDLLHFEFWLDKYDPVPEPRPVGKKGFASYILRTGKPLLLNEEFVNQMYESGVVEKSGTRSASWLGVPLRTHSQTIGVLAVQHYEDKHAYDQRDLELLGSVGSQIALAIERKRAESELRNTESQLRQSQKMDAIGRLAGGVAHDFNNLLTAIMGYSDLTLQRLEQDSPLRHRIEEIKKAGERAARLTQQLLAFSRKQILQPKVLDLNSVIIEMTKMLQRLIGEDIVLQTALDKSLGQVKADSGQVEQVLLNLVVNARDAMPQGGHLIIETSNVFLDWTHAKTHAMVCPAHYVMLSVSDTGCGMDAETQARIFEPFFTTKEAAKGTGLGLSTVYGIVKQSEGSIWVYSEPGKGTTFKIYLPRIDEVKTDTLDEEFESARKGHETILLVEDEDVVRALTREILEEYGYTLICASNGQEALRICDEFDGRIPLMITDVVMPNMSGRELAERLTVRRPETQVLYMSGFTDDAIFRHGLIDHEMLFIQKPFSADSLAVKVRELLDRTVLPEAEGKGGCAD